MSKRRRTASPADRVQPAMSNRSTWRRRLPVFAWLCVLGTLAAWSPNATASGVATGQAATTDPGVHPVSGRRIAQVMSHLGADWLDRPERSREEDPERAIEFLGLRPGQVVADVGAGSGYFSVRLARRVAPGGRVYATDLQPEMLARLRARLQREGIDGVELVLASEDDPRLPRGALDLVLMVDVYHELARPQVMLRRLRESLKPDGKLVLLEYRKEDPSIPIRPEHKMSVVEAKLELEAEGFTLHRVINALPRQHLLIFKP